MGGDPRKLGTILKKDESDQYYNLNCPFGDMDACLNALKDVVVLG